MYNAEFYTIYICHEKIYKISVNVMLKTCQVVNCSDLPVPSVVLETVTCKSNLLETVPKKADNII